jgi:proline dehydrogenase
MGVMRSVLLAASQWVWLRERAMHWGFVKRATQRFMPGERLEDALGAAAALQRGGTSTILTHLGENLAALSEADAVVAHYLQAQEQVRASGIDAEMSVKLTQLGLDQSPDACLQNLGRVADHARTLGRSVWIDMEGSAYTDVTLDLFRRVRRDRANVGICVQSYLRRTRADLDTLLPLGAAIRLVKGAYKEPATIAFPSKREVDESYFELAARLLSDEARRAGVFAGFGTHDGALIERITRHASATGVRKDAFEFEMLYGIRREAQARLVADGYRLRVLISYGEFWFPWYMRRLAERPANVLFVLKSLFGD